MKFINKLSSDNMSFLLEIFGSYCKPDSRYFKNKLYQDLAHNRNKAFAIFHICVVFVFICQAIFTNNASLKIIIGIIVCVFMTAIILLSPYYNPEVLKVLYNLFIGLFGPVIHWYTGEGAIRAWMGVHIYPTVILLCTGSVRHFLLQAVFQYIYMHTVLESRLLKAVTFMPPEAFMKTITEVSSGYCIINIIIILCVYATLESAYERILITEKRKTEIEIENQKLFLLSFSHELRNLINSLMGNVRLASLENLTIKAQKFLYNADVCGELLIHLINNILDTGKVEVGELEINPTSTNIYQTLEKMWSICSELIRTKGLAGKLKARNNLPKFLQVDPYRLTQILLNLIGNAVKFTDTGSIDVTIEWVNNITEVSESCFEPYPFDEDDELNEGIFEKERTLSFLDPNFVELTLTNPSFNRNLLKACDGMSKGLLKVIVTDTGSGMTKDDLSLLFQKFTQVSSDPSKRKLGTGLGLFITKQLCEKMGGQIRAFSKKDKGSCFIICIPLVPFISDKDFQRDCYKNENISKICAGKLRTMIVDDEPFSQTILQNFFSKLHIEVSEFARNGLEAYEKYMDHVIKGKPIPVITMDLTMPIMNGKEAAKLIRKYEVENNIKPCLIIVISGNCAESEIKECMDKNGKIRANAFVNKPAKIEDISKVIFSMISCDSQENMKTEIFV